MRVNKLRSLVIIICCLVVVLFSKVQCMEDLRISAPLNPNPGVYYTIKSYEINKFLTCTNEQYIKCFSEPSGSYVGVLGGAINNGNLWEISLTDNGYTIKSKLNSRKLTYTGELSNRGFSNSGHYIQVPYIDQGDDGYLWDIFPARNGCYKIKHKEFNPNFFNRAEEQYSAGCLTWTENHLLPPYNTGNYAQILYGPHYTCITHDKYLENGPWRNQILWEIKPHQ